MNLNKFKKAAMFGLDARIALAIFGALSVISGAALYSAIQESKVTAIITEFNEVGKAWEAYLLDTGTVVKQYSNDSSHYNFYVINVADLTVDPTVAGWSGPYLSYTASGSAFIHPTLGNLHLIYARNDIDWTNITLGKCTAGTSCSVWVRIYNASGFDASMAAALDARIDGSDGADKGKFRYDSNSVNMAYLAYKGPND